MQGLLRQGGPESQSPGLGSGAANLWARGTGAGPGRLLPDGEAWPGLEGQGLKGRVRGMKGLRVTGPGARHQAAGQR